MHIIGKILKGLGKGLLILASLIGLGGAIVFFMPLSFDPVAAAACAVIGVVSMILYVLLEQKDQQVPRRPGSFKEKEAANASSRALSPTAARHVAHEAAIHQKAELHAAAKALAKELPVTNRPLRKQRSWGRKFAQAFFMLALTGFVILLHSEGVSTTGLCFATGFGILVFHVIFQRHTPKEVSNWYDTEETDLFDLGSDAGIARAINFNTDTRTPHIRSM